MVNRKASSTDDNDVTPQILGRILACELRLSKIDSVAITDVPTPANAASKVDEMETRCSTLGQPLNRRTQGLSVRVSDVEKAISALETLKKNGQLDFKLAEARRMGFAGVPAIERSSNGLKIALSASAAVSAAQKRYGFVG